MENYFILKRTDGKTFNILKVIVYNPHEANYTPWNDKEYDMFVAATVGEAPQVLSIGQDEEINACPMSVEDLKVRNDGTAPNSRKSGELFLMKYTPPKGSWREPGYHMYVPKSMFFYQGTYAVRTRQFGPSENGNIWHDIADCYGIAKTGGFYVIKRVRALEDSVKRLTDMYLKLMGDDGITPNIMRPEKYFSLTEKYQKYLYVDIQRYRRKLLEYGF